MGACTLYYVEIEERTTRWIIISGVTSDDAMQEVREAGYTPLQATNVQPEGKYSFDIIYT